MRNSSILTEDQSLENLLVIWDYLSTVGLSFLLRRSSVLDGMRSSTRPRALRRSRFEDSDRTNSLSLRAT